MGATSQPLHFCLWAAPHLPGPAQPAALGCGHTVSSVTVSSVLSAGVTQSMKAGRVLDEVGTAALLGGGCHTALLPLPKHGYHCRLSQQQLLGSGFPKKLSFWRWCSQGPQTLKVWKPCRKGVDCVLQARALPFEMGFLQSHSSSWCQAPRGKIG